MAEATIKRIVNVSAVLIGVIVLLWLLNVAIRHVASGSGQAAAPSTAGNFSRLVCDDAYQTEDHSQESRNPPYVDMRLREGCFSGFISLPKTWTNWQEQFIGSAPDDWVSYWYKGLSAPYGPYSEAQVNSETINIGTVPFPALRVEGHGVIRFYRITTQSYSDASTPPPSRPLGERHSAQPEAGQSAPPKEQPVHLTAPTSRQDSDFPMMLGTCHRLSDRIECWGFVKNTTDAPSLVYLMDSTAVDDEGRSFFLGSAFGANIRFDQGDMERLMPNVNTRFVVDVPDPHENVKSVNLQLNTEWGTPERHAHAIFENIPVQ